MRFKSVLHEAILLKRLFQFLALVVTPKKQRHLIRCPNLGPLSHANVLGTRVWFSDPLPPPIEYLPTWELAEIDGGALVCVNLEQVRPLIFEAIRSNRILELKDFQIAQTNVAKDPLLPLEILLKKGGQSCLVTVQAITDGHRVEQKPVSPSFGLAQIERLSTFARNGHRGVLCYLVQNTGIQYLPLDSYLDSKHIQPLQQALACGVEIIAYQTAISLQGMQIQRAVPIVLSHQVI